MKAFSFTVPNTDRWAICNTEIVVVAKDEEAARVIIGKDPQYKGYKDDKLIELGKGIHIIQEMQTE